jgi:DNA-binding XRE family transcriptional regulator
VNLSRAGSKLSKAKKNRLPRNEEDLAALRKQQGQVARAFASLLRTRRQDADITQAQMGYALGVSEDVVFKMEALKKPIPLEQGIVWVIVTGDDVAEFFEDLQYSLRKVFPRKS